jgi:hypothetical protein
MKRDFKTCMLYSLLGLPIFLLAWIVILYLANCGFSTDCSQASLPGVIHTPIPTLIPATMVSPEKAEVSGTQAKCTTTARILLEAWVRAGYQENEPFQFTDIRQTTCVATYQDVRLIFSEANLWHPGALACVQCHNSDIATASANMDLSSFEGILMGGKRTSPEVQGEDILAGGNWEQSIMHDVLFGKKSMPFGRPPGAVPEDGPTVQVGTPVEIP